MDDLGHGGIMDNNPLVKGPRVSELKASGVYLARHYGVRMMSLLESQAAGVSQPAAMSQPVRSHRSFALHCGVLAKLTYG